MATLSFYLVVVGGIALLASFTLHVAHVALIVAGDRSVRPLVIAPPSGGAQGATRNSFGGSLGAALRGGAPTTSDARTAVGDVGGALAVVAVAILVAVAPAFTTPSSPGLRIASAPFAVAVRIASSGESRRM